METHAFASQAVKATHVRRLRFVVTGFAFCLALSQAPKLSAGGSNGWTWTSVSGGWIIQTPTGGVAYFPDKSHKWNGTAKIEQISATAVRFNVPSGWIVATLAGAVYVPDSNHAWPAPVIVPVPMPSPTPSPSASAPEPTPSPTTSESPTPTPSPTPGPTSSGFKTVPKNMTLQSNGFYRSNDLHKDNVAYVQGRLDTPVKGGQTARFIYQQKTNVIKSGSNGNIKDGRDYPDSNTTYPNDYTGRTIASGNDQVTCEDGHGNVRYQSKYPSNWTTAYFSSGFKADVVQTVEKELTYAQPGKSNGHVRIVVDGVVKIDADGWACEGPRGDFGVQMVYANPGSTGGFPAGSYLEAKILDLKVLP